MAWVGASRPLDHPEPPLLPNSTRRKLLGEGVVGLAYLESRTGWPVPVHAVKYIPAEAVAEVRAPHERSTLSADCASTSAGHARYAA
jgi:hypothetical protein